MNAPFSPMHPGDIGDGLRAPPHSFEAEQALLGAIMAKNAILDDLIEFLRPAHFADPTHGDIYTICVEQRNKQRPVTPVTLKSLMSDHAGVADMGGDAYLINLYAAQAGAIDARSYARMIFDYAKRRELIGMGEDLVNAAFDTAGPDAEDIQIAHEAKLVELAMDGVVSEGFRDFKEVSADALSQLELAFKNRGKVVGISTGYSDLDKRMGGLRPSDLIILGGRPAMGKTSCATGIAVNAARAAYRVGIFSLEMSGQQLASRVLCAHANVEYSAALRGDLTDDGMHNLAMAQAEISDLPLFIDDTGARSVGAIRAESRRLKRRSGLDLIVVDYIGLATPNDPRDRRQKVHQIEEITNGLKAMAKELKVPVLALCQLSRGLEQREDKRPMMSDLRDSGSIEQDADVVLFVYREEYYLQNAEPVQRAEEGAEKYAARLANWERRMSEVRNTAEIIVAKNRFGATGSVSLHFNGALTKFSDLYQPSEGGAF